MFNYTLKRTRTGKEWKQIADGCEDFEDDSKYEIQWYPKTFKQLLTVWWSNQTKQHFEFVE